MYEDFTLIKGKKQGLVSVILAGIHGNETCGIQAFQKILPSLKIDKGEVWFGYGNPKAIEQNIRFIDTNLNRLFKADKKLTDTEKQSYEYKRAQILKKYLNKADALLDLHASNTPDAKPFIISEANASSLIKYIPIDLVVSGFDKIQPGGTNYYMNAKGKIGICIECGYVDDPISTGRAIESIKAFLVAQGHTSDTVLPQKQDHLTISELYITQSNSFTLSQPFKDFQKITKGELIGTDDTLEIRASGESSILFARNRSQAGAEGFILIEKKK